MCLNDLFIVEGSPTLGVDGLNLVESSRGKAQKGNVECQRIQSKAAGLELTALCES